jgi:hypothetical protein
MYVLAAEFGVLGVGELTLAGSALAGVSTPGEGLLGLAASAAFIALAFGCVAMGRAEVLVAGEGVAVANRGQRVMKSVVLAIAEGA